MLPDGWSEGYVKELIKSLDAGTSVNSIDDSNPNASYKILKTSCVSNGTFCGILTKSVVEAAEISKLREPVASDSIILSRMNTPALVGANGYVEFAPKNTYLPDRLWQLKPRPNVVEMRWLAYWFGSDHSRYRLSKLGTGTSGSMKNIKKSDVLNLSLLIPPLGEQKRISQILSTWDKAITTTEQLLANSQQQKKALMQQLLTGKKRLLDENDVRFSGEWINGRLGDLLIFKGGSAFKEKYQGNSVGDLPFVKVSDMNLVGNEKYINRANNWVSKTEATLMKAAPFPENTIVFAKVGAALRLNRRRILSASTIIDNNMMAAIPRQLPDTEFLYQLLLAIDFAKFVQDGAVPSVNQSDLNAFKITYPDFDERHKIAKVLATAEQQSKDLKQTLLVLKQEKKALMQQLLTGKRRVKIDEDAA